MQRTNGSALVVAGRDEEYADNQDALLKGEGTTHVQVSLGIIRWHI